MNHAFSVIIDGALFMLGWKTADFVFKHLEAWFKFVLKFVKKHLTY